MTYQISSELHEKAVAELVKKCGASADTLIREAHSKAADYDARYEKPQHVRHPRFNQMRTSMQTMLVLQQRDYDKRWLTMHRSELVGMYVVSGLSREVAQAIVQFATRGRD